MENTEVLAQVVERVELRLRAEPLAPRPLVLFDLDGTLYDNRPRTRRILEEWLASAEALRAPASVPGRLRTLPAEAPFYSLADAFALVGLDLAAPEIGAALAQARAHWEPRFFASAYVGHDHPYPGGADYVTELFQAGAEIVYLSGRDFATMGEGTAAALRRDGFPLDGERARLLLKPEPTRDDSTHKTEAARTLSGAVACFDNEPRDLIALQDALPAAMHVLRPTPCSTHPAPIGRTFYQVSDFRR